MTVKIEAAPPEGAVCRMLPAFRREAQIVPGSLDEKERTFDIVWSAGAAVQRYDWVQGVRYFETLNLDAKSIRLHRMQIGGVPVLDSHQRNRLGDVIGAVVKDSIKLGDGVARAKVRMSNRPEVAGIVGDIRDGIISNVSPGYVTHAYTESVKDGQTYRDATDWEPMEISFVPVGADPDAGVARAAGDPKTPQGPYPCIVTRAVEPPAVADAAAAAARMRMRARAAAL